MYLNQEGRGIGLPTSSGPTRCRTRVDTVEANEGLGLQADLRDYGIGAQILVDLGVPMRLMTNNPQKIVGLEGYGLTVAERVPLETRANPHNIRYLTAKRDKMGHTLHHQGLAFDEEMF